MGRRRQSEAAELESRLRERDPEHGTALVEMRIDVVFNDDVMISVGGRWDRRAKSFDPVIEGTDIGDPDGSASAIVVSPHAGEVPTLLWFITWLNHHAHRRTHPPSLDEAAMLALESTEIEPWEVFAALLAGGRRGGKTWTAALCCAIYAVLFPGAIIWVVNPSDKKHDECREYFAGLLAPEWVDRETAAGWDLANGSTIMLKSGYVGADPDAIKEGKANLVWLNEGQKMAERVYIVGRGATADQSGLVLICANPPVQAKDQQWVGDFAADAQAGRRMAIYHHFDPRENPHINRVALLSMKRELDERSYRIEILGEFLPPAAMVAYNWIRTKDGNERTRPEPDDPNWIDVTEMYIRVIENLGEGITDIPGMDFQVHPYMGGPVYRIFMPRNAKSPNRGNVVMWAVDELVLDGDEAEWCMLAKEKGYDPDSTLIIGDGTGEYQHSRRGAVDSPPPEWTGKGSFDVIKMHGFRNIIRPSPRIKRNNPHVIDRVRAMTSMIESGAKVRRLFIDPDRCPKTAKSIREWPTVHGKPSRVHEAAHLGDGASYPIVRLFPRILRSEKPGQVDPIQERVDLPMVKPKFLGPPPSGRPRGRDAGRTL